MKMAVRETISFLTERFPKLSRQEAYMIASIAVDYHVTQLVDGTKGHPRNDPEGDLHCAVKKGIARHERCPCRPGTRGALSACERFTVSPAPVGQG
jgi:hypothetical protein